MHNLWFVFVSVGGNVNLVVSFLLITYLCTWFTKMGKVHLLTILVYLPVCYPPLYPENKSWYIFLCLFVFCFLNKKTQLNKSLSAHCTSELWSTHYPSWGLVICAISGFLSILRMGWDVTFLPYHFISALFVISSRRSLSSDSWGRFWCHILRSFTGGMAFLGWMSILFHTTSKE